MQKYTVQWEQDILAETPEAAAEEAFHIMSVGYSEPLCVDVKDMSGNSVRVYSIGE